MHVSRLSAGHVDDAPADAPLSSLSEGFVGVASFSSPSSSSSEAETSLTLRPSVDENLLLAETEAILATLDAAAFASPRASVSGGNVTNAIVLPGRPRVSSSSVIIARPAKTRTPTRDKTKEELALLRKAQVKLEGQLSQLQQKHNSLVAVRNSREQTWRKLAERQFRMRQLAEADNAQLKAMLLECLKHSDAHTFSRAFSMDDALMRLPNYAHGPPKRPLGVPRHMVLSGVFEPLLRRLDTGYAEMDAIFRENGMDQGLLQARSYAAKKTRKRGDAQQYLELVDMRLTPFEADLFGDVTWRCNKDWHLKDSPYVYPCASGSNDTFAVNYRMKSNAFEADESVNYYLVMRRCREVDRYVMMFTTQSDGEMELAGASSNEIGWLVVTDASLVNNQEGEAGTDPSPPPPSPSAVVRSCLHITLTGADSVKQNRLMSRLVSAFEEDVAFIRQHVDSLLLQESRARVDQFADTRSSLYS